MKEFLSKVMDAALGPASMKLKMILNIMFHHWEFIPCMLYPLSARLRGISEQDLQRVYQGIDSRSMDILRKHLHCVSFAVPENAMRMYFFHFSCLYPEGEKPLRAQTKKEIGRLKRKYHLAGACVPESLIRHHGLRDQPSSVKEYLRNKVFLDVGAYNGDSSCVLFSYNPSKIYAFEPDEKMIRNFKNTMKKNGFPPCSCEIVPFLVGRENGEGTVSLDHFIRTKPAEPIGFLKADVEGAGLELIKGAENLIRTNRPVISIAIYHNPDEFLGIYPLLKEWNLHYHIEIRSLGLPLMLTETVLLAVPEELIPDRQSVPPGPQPQVPAFPS